MQCYHRLGLLVLIALMPTSKAATEEWAVSDAPWALRFEYTASNNGTVRDMDVAAFMLQRPLREAGALTAGFETGLMIAEGRASEDDGATYFPADAIGLLAGGYLRMAPEEATGIAPVLEVGAAALVTDRNFPDPIEELDASILLHAKFDFRLGLDIPAGNGTLSPLITFTHISNGRGVGRDNVNYNGLGLSVSYAAEW